MTSVHADTGRAAYSVRQTDGDIELRAYPPATYAQITIDGPRETAIKQGFDLLLAYLDKGNEAQQKIDMILPLMQTQSNQVPEQWTGSILLPTSLAARTAPIPLDNRIVRQDRTDENWAVIRFSGSLSPHNVGEHEQQLRDWLVQHNHNFKPAARYAFFDPPWMPPFMRHNEVMLQLAP